MLEEGLAQTIVKDRWRLFKRDMLVRVLWPYQQSEERQGRNHRALQHLARFAVYEITPINIDGEVIGGFSNRL